MPVDYSQEISKLLNSLCNEPKKYKFIYSKYLELIQDKFGCPKTIYDMMRQVNEKREYGITCYKVPTEQNSIDNIRNAFNNFVYNELRKIANDIDKCMENDENEKEKYKKEFNMKMNQILEENTEDKFIDFFTFARKWNHEFDSKFKQLNGYWNTNLCQPIYNIWNDYLEKKLTLIKNKIKKHTPDFELEKIKSNEPFEYKERGTLIKYQPFIRYGGTIELSSEGQIQTYNRIISHLHAREEYFEKRKNFLDKQRQNIIERKNILKEKRKKQLEIAGITEEELEKIVLKSVLIKEKIDEIDPRKKSSKK